MILKQYYLGCLAHASYLIADPESGTAVVVDPQRDVDQYERDARELGAAIRHVFLTHFHADFLAGHLELRHRVGARIALGSRAEAEFAFDGYQDGQSLEFGRVRITVWHTPGHTPESVSLLVFDRDRSETEPQAVLTGDTLFIGDVGRPDLMASQGVTAEQLASWLYDSLHGKLLRLPDATLVYPAHGAGSLCGRNLGKETVSTIGDQRRYNYALQPMSREAFVGLVTAEQPEAPDYFAYDAELNRRERTTLDEALRRELIGLSLDRFQAAVAAGAQVVDTREPRDFAAGHWRGALSIPLSGQYATWAGTLLDRDRPIVLVAEPGGEEESAMRLGRIGLDRVAGFLEGGPEALDAVPERTSRTSRITAVALAERLSAADPPFVLDVRTPREWAGG
ncbi:MAG: MBL fold metallo-hydrolase, partial [Chloroflexi bacterium]|nr:MBL fold metallo-hydrolase [Chloroflexota bacterium]